MLSQGGYVFMIDGKVYLFLNQHHIKKMLVLYVAPIDIKTVFISMVAPYQHHRLEMLVLSVGVQSSSPI